MFIVEKSFLFLSVVIHFSFNLAFFSSTYAQPEWQNDIENVSARLQGDLNLLKLKLNNLFGRNYTCRLSRDDKKDLCILSYGLMKKNTNISFEKNTNDSENSNYRCRFEKLRFVKGPSAGSFTWINMLRCPIYVLKKYVNDYVFSDSFYITTGDILNSIFVFNENPANSKEVIIKGFAYGLDYMSKVPRSRFFKKSRHKRIHVEEDSEDVIPGMEAN